MKRIAIVMILFCFIYYLSFCGDDGVKCGPGTIERDGECVPYCGPGTYLDENGYCRPINGSDGDVDSDGDIDKEQDENIDQQILDTSNELEVDLSSTDNSIDDIEVDYQSDICEDQNCSNIIEQLYNLLLQDREESCGQDSLELNDTLSQAAKEISDQMATSGSLSACSEVDLGALLQRYGIVYSHAGHFCGGAYGSVEAAYDNFWSNTEIRTDYILNCRFSLVGIGVSPDPNASNRFWLDIILVDTD